MNVCLLCQAIDIWMGACTGFIFAALLEFTLTNYLWRKGQKLRGTQNSSEPNNSNFGAMAATATVAAAGLDPNMFTHMVSAGAVTGNAAADDTFTRSQYTEKNEEEMPLTSPAHNLLKRKPFYQFPLRSR